MSILIMGMGYVGLTTALVFSELGWKVTGMDPDERKINSLLQGALPFYEPGLGTLLKKHLHANMSFSSDPKTAVQQHSFVFLCVGTPSQTDGSANLGYIQQAAEWIGKYMQEYKLIVVKSTVPIGTQEKIARWIQDAQPLPIPFDVISNPEFLREGTALHDALSPDRIIIGSNSEQAAEQLKQLYVKLDCPVQITTPKTAEIIKYAANAFLATKISFVNELARFCDKIGVNISDVSEGIGMDHRIGKHFLRAGIGYGGSCFPKDVKALLFTAKEKQAQLTILEKVFQVNETQFLYFLDNLERQLASFQGKTIAILGLAFKPDTDDLRESPALSVIKSLVEKQAVVRAHDPVAKLPSTFLSDKVIQCETIEETVSQADAVILCTEWPEYRKTNWGELKKRMKQHYFFDGRNVLSSEQMSAWGFHYQGIGNR